MARKAALTEVDIKKAEPKDKQYNLHDVDGLFVTVLPTGTKSFRFKYFLDGKEKRTVFGVWPELSLKEARALRDRARLKVKDGIDPVERKVRFSPSLTFEAVTQEWYDRQILSWSDKHAETVMKRLRKDVFPSLGSIMITELTPVQILDCLRRAEARGAIETAHRQLIIIRDVLNYAIAKQIITVNPALSVKPALKKKPPKKHMAAPSELSELRRILLAIDNYQGTPIIKTALQILPHIFCRPGEIQKMRWKEIDFDEAQWRYILSKTGQPHIVPLSRQVIALLKYMQGISGDHEFVFPSWRTGSPRSMSDNALTYALRDLGFTGDEICAHGFRAVARTFIDERLRIPEKFIEAQLGHNVKDALGRAYNRTTFIEDRTDMMQRWSNYLDEIKKKS